MRFIILLIWIILFGLFSCKEEIDDIPPTITFLSPSENSSFEYDDAIEIKARITDDNIIKSVQLSLISEQTKNRVLQTITYNPNSTSFDLNQFYILSDSLLPGGIYYFRIEAKDEYNSFSAFRFIKFSSFPKKKLSCVISCSIQNSTTVYEDRNDFVFQSVSSFSDSYLASNLNSYDQQYWFIPKNGKSLRALDLRSYVIPFIKTFNSSLNDLFSTSRLVDRTLFISLKTGELQAYNNRFQDVYTYLSPNQKKLGQLAIGEKFVLQEEVDVTGNNREVIVLFRSNGNIKSRFPINLAISNLFLLEETKAILFQNDINGGVIQELNFEAGGGLTKIRNMTDSILAVEKVSGNEYLISSPKKIIRYTHNPNKTFDYLFLDGAVVEYDELNNQLYVASGNLLNLYNYRQTNVLSSTTLPNPIRGIDIRYNY